MRTVSELVEGLHKRLYPPTPHVIRFLRGRGISVDALAEPELPALSDVVFHGDRPVFFDFTDEAGCEGAFPALIFLARDELGEPCDLVAWSRKKNRLAAWYGAASLLGAETLFAPRLGDGLHVYPDVLEWLRADRDGVVIVNAERARRVLVGDRLIVDDPAFGRLLRDALRWPEPEIFIERAGRVA
jgi:hypothetical protein